MLQASTKRQRRTDARQTDTSAAVAQADRPEKENWEVTNEWPAETVRRVSGRVFGRDQSRNTVDNQELHSSD